jgi:hypothetical protein
MGARGMTDPPTYFATSGPLDGPTLYRDCPPAIGLVLERVGHMPDGIAFAVRPAARRRGHPGR